MIGQAIGSYWKHFNKRLGVVYFLLALCSFNTGMYSAGFSSVIAMDGFIDRFGDQDPITGQSIIPPYFMSLLTSLQYIGCAAGLSLGSWISDKWGRRRAIFVASVYYFIPAIICIYSKHKNQLLIGKVLSYAHIGMILSVVPVFLTEIAPAPLRGMFVSTYELAGTLGALVMSIVCFKTAQYPGDSSWLIPFEIFMVLPVVLSGAVWVMPESPRYLLANNREKEAFDVLQTLRPGCCEEELNNIQTQLNDTLTETSASYRQLFTGSNLRRTLISIIVNLFVQITGQPFLSLHGGVFMRTLGIDPFPVQLTSALICVLALINCMVVVDKVGRKPLMLTSMAANGLGMVALGTIGSLYGIILDNTQKLAVMVAILLMQVMFSCGWGPLAQLVVTEVANPHLRNKTQQVSQTVYITSSFLSNLVVPYVVYAPLNLNLRIGFVYGTISFIAVFYTIYFVPECKNKTLEEIDQLFTSNISVAKFQSYGTIPRQFED